MSKREKIEGFLDRLERAENLLMEGKVHRVEGLNKVYVVRGSQPYLVDLEVETCNCPDYSKGHVCKHLLAVLLLERAERKKAKSLNRMA